jgi:hypothetical protein
MEASSTRSTRGAASAKRMRWYEARLIDILIVWAAITFILTAWQ